MKTKVLLAIIVSLISNYVFSQKQITAEEAINNIGETVTICDKISDARFLESSPGKFTLLNIGGRFPNQKLTIVISEVNRNNFPLRPEIFYLNKSVCVSGKVTLYRQKPQIQISGPGSITVTTDALEATKPTTPPSSPKANTSNFDYGIRTSSTTPIVIVTSDLTYEAGISVGSMNGVTDIGRKKSSVFLPATVDWRSTKGNVSLYGGVLYRNTFGARLEMTYGRVAGNDKNGLYPDRNLSYRSKIFEVAAIGECFILKDNRLSPYIMGGVGVFSFNPQAKYKDNWVNLKPLHTEGEGFSEYSDRLDYKLTDLCLPFGAGVRYSLSDAFNLKLEALYRYTFTDYLDDASTTYIEAALFSKYLSASDATMAAALSKPNARFPNYYRRGGTKSKDKYFTINLKFGIKLPKF
jgi:opacity protein-like surface antigen